MSLLSAQKEYEKAALIRDRIKRLDSIQEQQNVELDTNQHYFFIGFSSNEHYHYGVCQHFAYKRFISQHGKYAALSTNILEFIRQFVVSIIKDSPKKIHLILSKDYELENDWLAEFEDKEIVVQTPSKGRYYELLTLVELNAQKSLIGISKNAVTRLLDLLFLLKDLKMNTQPKMFGLIFIFMEQVL